MTKMWQMAATSPDWLCRRGRVSASRRQGQRTNRATDFVDERLKGASPLLVFAGHFAKGRRYRNLLVSLAVVGIAAYGVPLMADPFEVPSTHSRLVPFSEFRQTVSDAEATNYVGREGFEVKDRASFEEMKRHVASLYDGIQVEYSFLDEDHVVDCIPIDKQPGLTRVGMEHHVLQRVPTPVAASVSGGVLSSLGLESQESQVRQHSKGNLKSDALGNLMRCPPDYIPMRRLNLEDVARYASLSDFFRKSDAIQICNAGVAPSPQRTPAPPVHRYAIASQEQVNYGGYSNMTIWSPRTAPRQMSLSQMWLVGCSGEHGQTAEVGWQVYPTLYHTSKAVLFTYWTADNYSDGCYNLTCKAFIQTDATFILGGTFSKYSVRGGAQVLLHVSWVRDSGTGNWWLYVGDASHGPDSYAIGYFPAELYRDGQLSRWSTRLAFGGETTGQPISEEMGSGSPASAGQAQAALQGVNFFPVDGNVVELNLIPQETNPDCYTIKLLRGCSMGTACAFFFGGSRCE